MTQKLGEPLGYAERAVQQALPTLEPDPGNAGAGKRISKGLLWQELIMDPARDSEPVGRKYTSFRRRVIAVAIAVIIIVAGFTIYYSITSGNHGGKKVLTIYAYDSFLKYGNNYNKTFSTVFGTFAREHNVTINVVNKSNLLPTLESQKGTPGADIVIGLTNMNGVTAVSNNLLVKYSPPGASYVNSSLMNEMGSAVSYLTPYEYSYLGIDYNRSFVNNTAFAPHGQFFPSFENLTNSSLASNLLMENPTIDDTGEGFLLWEIAYYQHVLHENWTKFWNSTKAYATGNVLDSWGTAFGQYDTGPGTNMVVSYLTDPAYNVYNGYGNGSGSTVTYHNGTAYGWRTIYGIGIVNGSHNLSLDRQFVSYFLNQTVQSQLPLNEWMYPANQSTPLPPVFGVLPDQSNIQPLNNYLNATQISLNIKAWELQWQSIQVS